MLALKLLFQELDIILLVKLTEVKTKNREILVRLM